MHYVLSGFIGLAVMAVLVIASIDSILFFAYTGDYAKSITNQVGIANTGIDAAMLKGIQGYILGALAAYIILMILYRAARR